jgi:hypothetical protein
MGLTVLKLLKIKIFDKLKEIIGLISNNMSQNNRTLLLKSSLLQFYEKKDHMQIILKIINKNTEYSLRLLEWFCSNYSKKYNTIYNVSKNKEFNVYLSYKSQLDSYQKKQFDPFKRNYKGYEKFDLFYSPDKSFKTTVGQLNFFKWCIENKILDYVKDHIMAIKNDMNESLNYTDNGTVNSTASTGTTNGGTTPKTTNRKKRQALSTSAIRTCVKRYTNIIIKF